MKFVDIYEDSLGVSFAKDEIALIEVGSDSHGSQAFFWCANKKYKDGQYHPSRIPINDRYPRTESEYIALKRALKNVSRGDYWMVIIMTNSETLIENIRHNQPPTNAPDWRHWEVTRMLEELEGFHIRTGLNRMKPYAR